jgi:hypothetical protein
MSAPATVSMSCRGTRHPGDIGVRGVRVNAQLSAFAWLRCPADVSSLDMTRNVGQQSTCHGRHEGSTGRRSPQFRSSCGALMLGCPSHTSSFFMTDCWPTSFGVRRSSPLSIRAERHRRARTASSLHESGDDRRTPNRACCHPCHRRYLAAYPPTHARHDKVIEDHSLVGSRNLAGSLRYAQDDRIRSGTDL